MKILIKAILASDIKGGISLKGVMPWPHNKEDLSYFKNMTKGKTVIMGRKTWEASDMPSPLPNRKNIVVTTDPTYSDIGIDLIIFDNIAKNISVLAENNEVWIIGGASLVHNCLTIIDELHLTLFPINYECDTNIDLDLIYDTFKIEKYEKVSDYYRMILKKK